MRFGLLLAPVGAYAVAAIVNDFDFGAINSAPSPTLTVPPLIAVVQTTSYDIAAVLSVGSAAVTSVAQAATAPSATGKAKRDNGATASNTQSSTVSSSTATSKPTATTGSTTISTSGSSTGTSTTSSESSCPTTPEEGTYCGFINPEDPCAPQPDGYGPVPATDDVTNFEAMPQFHTWAQNAKTPSGYDRTFKDLNASVSANSYLGLHTLRSYDPLGCSQWCDNTTLCTGFNLYIERDPKLNPTEGCPYPSSITNFKCTLWGSGVEPAAANNFGGWRNAFQVVIAGSNGYEKTNNTQPVTPKGCSKPQKCSNGIIHEPRSCLGTKFFPGPFDINLCAAYAQAQNSYNNKLNIFSLTSRCRQFNAYMIKRDGVAQGTYCGLYSQTFSTRDAGYLPGRQGNHFWGVESSCITNVNDDGWFWK